MNTRMRNKNGDLSLYAFSCGYIQRAGDLLDEAYVDLFLDGVWHIQYRETKDSDRGWDTFESLTEARKAWRKHVKRLQLPYP